MRRSGSRWFGSPQVLVLAAVAAVALGAPTAAESLPPKPSCHGISTLHSVVHVQAACAIVTACQDGHGQLFCAYELTLVAEVHWPYAGLFLVYGRFDLAHLSAPIPVPSVTERVCVGAVGVAADVSCELRESFNVPLLTPIAVACEAHDNRPRQPNVTLEVHCDLEQRTYLPPG